jgi:hypothetical protein
MLYVFRVTLSNYAPQTRVSERVARVTESFAKLLARLTDAQVQQLVREVIEMEDAEIDAAGG